MQKTAAAQISVFCLQLALEHDADLRHATELGVKCQVLCNSATINRWQISVLEVAQKQCMTYCCSHVFIYLSQRMMYIIQLDYMIVYSLERLS